MEENGEENRFRLESSTPKMERADEFELTFAYKVFCATLRSVFPFCGYLITRFPSARSPFCSVRSRRDSKQHREDTNTRCSVRDQRRALCAEERATDRPLRPTTLEHCSPASWSPPLRPAAAPSLLSRAPAVAVWERPARAAPSARWSALKTIWVCCLRRSRTGSHCAALRLSCILFLQAASVSFWVSEEAEWSRTRAVHLKYILLSEIPNLSSRIFFSISNWFWLCFMINTYKLDNDLHRLRKLFILF